MTTSPLTLLLNAHDAAKAMGGICEKTLWSMTWPRGELPCVRIGRRVLYDPRDITAWIDKRKEGGQPT